MNLPPLGYEKANSSNYNDLHAVTGKQKSAEGMVRKGREVLLWGQCGVELTDCRQLGNSPKGRSMHEPSLKMQKQKIGLFGRLLLDGSVHTL